MTLLSRWSLAECALATALLAATASAGEGEVAELAPLEKPRTSFGAAIADGSLYVYGGHLGAPHEYSAEMQANQLLRLNPASPGKWESLGQGPRRTGLALVAHGSKLYRVGGWEARNTKEDEWDLYSSPDFARFDPKVGQWKDLAPLPRGRSSHDAAVLGSKLYVVGGWELQGGDGDWHDTAYVCDLAAEKPEWKEIARPSFRRRALAAATYAGKVYAIGGMDDGAEITTAVDVYDPQSDKWSTGPAMPGEANGGFGVSAIGTKSGLYASPRSGEVYRLDAAEGAWKQVGKLQHPRFFHRLLAVDDGRLLAVGGTARGGKVAEVETLSVTAAAGE
jgi:N-acetylneuraminic acid mutarotase